MASARVLGQRMHERRTLPDRKRSGPSPGPCPPPGSRNQSREGLVVRDVFVFALWLQSCEDHDQTSRSEAVEGKGLPHEGLLAQGRYLVSVWECG